LALVIRIRDRRRFAASTQDVWLVSGYENLAVLCAGAFVCVAAFALAGGWPPLLAIVIAGVALALAVAVRPAFFRRWARALLARRLAATLGELLAIAVTEAVNAVLRVFSARRSGSRLRPG